MCENVVFVYAKNVCIKCMRKYMKKRKKKAYII